MKTLRVHEDKVYLGHFGSEYWGFYGVTIDVRQSFLLLFTA